MIKDSRNMDENMDYIIQCYSNLVFGIALTHTQNRSDAEDVFQEVFLIYHRKRPDFHEQEHQKAWLIRTAINCSKRITHSNWRKKVMLEQPPEGVFEFRTEEENKVYSALSKLPSKYKTPIYLFYFEEMSIKEISNFLKTKQGTVKVHLSRGRAMLRDMLKGVYFYE